jgi:hypothetical protein
MNEKTKQGLRVLEAALLLGVLGDGLLRATPLGLNVLLWTGAIVIAMVALMVRWRRRALSGGGHFLLLSIILFAAAFAWRDSLTLNLLAGLGLFLTLALAAWRARGESGWPESQSMRSPSGLRPSMRFASAFHYCSEMCNGVKSRTRDGPAI